MKIASSEIIDIISRSIVEQLSDEDQKILDLWLQENDNRELYCRLKDPNYLLEDYCLYREFENKRPADKEPSRKRLFLHISTTIAAACVLLGFYLLGSHLVYKNSASETMSLADDITTPIGTENKAILILSDGQKVTIQGQEGEFNDKLSVIENDGTKLSYSTINTDTDQSAIADRQYNTLQIPRGSTFTVILNDGSKVTLNSSSSLKYPTTFDPNIREVWLDGEAYFSVEKNPDQPFVVHSATQKIIVTGTEFNVCAYADQSTITALVNGSITVSSQNIEAHLSPGQIAINNGETISMMVGDTEFYTSWINNRFAFQEEELVKLLKKFERWYDVHFQIEDMDLLSHKSFTGYIPRYKELSDLLELLRVSMEIELVETENQTIIVKNSN